MAGAVHVQLCRLSSASDRGLAAKACFTPLGWFSVEAVGGLNTGLLLALKANVLPFYR